MRTTTRLGLIGTSAALLTTAFAGAAVAQDESVAGTIDVHGSSTVYPISTSVSEKFQEQNDDFGYTVGFEGTGDGFNQYFCPNVSDVSDASRPIRDSEAEICAENGVSWTELKVAYDGMAVLTSTENALECVNFNDLYAIFGAESNDIRSYEEATAFAQELGSTTDLGSGPIQNTAPGPESGTFDSFAEIVLEGIAEERGVEGDAMRDPVPPAWTGAANDQVIVAGISQARNPAVYTFVGLAYAEEAGDTVKVLAVDSGDGNCVEPTAETVSAGEYPISRPLFIYPGLDNLEDNPVIVPWVDFYLSDEGMASVAETGYVDLPAEELQATRDQWEAAKAGDESAIDARTWTESSE